MEIVNRKSHTLLVQMVTNCKVCMRMIRKHIASEVGSHTSEKKAMASRENGKLGGRPRIKR